MIADIADPPRRPTVITHDSKLYEIPWAPNLDMRKVMVANALSVIDVEAADQRTRHTLELLLGPLNGRWDLDRPFRCWKDQATGKWRTEGVSTCALVAEGLWRRAGVEAPWLSAEYVPGGPFRGPRFAQRLQPRSAWHTPQDGQRPQPGDYVVIGTGLQTHALTVVGWDGDELVSVDGGQVGTRGLQAIHRCRRPWLGSGNAASLGGRVVQGWVAVEMLPYRGPVVVPVGWESVEV